MEVEKVIKVPETVTVERVIKIPEIVEKPTVKFKYRIKYIRNPLEFAVIGIACLVVGIIIGFLL